MTKSTDQIRQQKQEAKDRAINIMESYGYDPIEQLVISAQSADTSASDKISVHKELAKYIYPQLKSIDHKHTVSGGLSVEIIQFSQPKEEPINGNTTSVQVETSSVSS